MRPLPFFSFQRFPMRMSQAIIQFENELHKDEHFRKTIEKSKEVLIKRGIKNTLLRLAQILFLTNRFDIFQLVYYTSLVMKGGTFPMRAKIHKVNAFEAKTRLSELLRETEQGGSYIICRRGKEVACLIPPVNAAKEVNLKEMLSSFHEIRQQISGKVNIRKLIEEGRRY